MNRREFLVAGGLLGGAVGVGAADLKKLLPPPPKPKPPLVGSQLYGWGQYYGRMGKDFGKSLDEILIALKDAGYDYAEGNLDVAVPENNARFADQLRKHGLKAVALYTGGATHVLGQATQTCERIAKAAAEAGKAGFGILNFNPDPIGRAKTDRELEIQAEALTELGEDIRKAGMKLGIHHHTPEMANGGHEFHSNFRRCPADTVGFCYDVHWVFRGGIYPADCLTTYGDRIVSWHLRQSRDQIWWEDLDSGDIDYTAIAAEVKARKLPQFLTVELAIEGGSKVTRTVVENHVRSRQFVRRVFGV
jgi:inosose dehydratase